MGEGCGDVSNASSSSTSRVVSYEEMEAASSISGVPLLLPFVCMFVWTAGSSGGGGGVGDGRSFERAGTAGGRRVGAGKVIDALGEGERLVLRRAERRGLRSGEGTCRIGGSVDGMDGVSGTDISLDSLTIAGEPSGCPRPEIELFCSASSSASMLAPMEGGARATNSIVLGSCSLRCSLFCFATSSTMLIRLCSPWLFTLDFPPVPVIRPDLGVLPLPAPGPIPSSDTVRLCDVDALCLSGVAWYMAASLCDSIPTGADAALNIECFDIELLREMTASVGRAAGSIFTRFLPVSVP